MCALGCSKAVILLLSLSRLFEDKRRDIVFGFRKFRIIPHLLKNRGGGNEFSEFAC